MRRRLTVGLAVLAVGLVLATAGTAQAQRRARGYSSGYPMYDALTGGYSPYGMTGAFPQYGGYMGTGPYSYPGAWQGANYGYTNPQGYAYPQGTTYGSSYPYGQMAPGTSYPMTGTMQYGTGVAGQSSGLMQAMYGTTSMPAMVRVVLPAPDAKLTLEGQDTQGTGTVRDFTSPPLDPNQTYQYTVRAQWKQGDQTKEETRTVDVRAGSRVSVDFRNPQGVGTPMPFPGGATTTPGAAGTTNPGGTTTVPGTSGSTAPATPGTDTPPRRPNPDGSGNP